MSTVDTPKVLALEVAAPRVEWAENTDVSTPEADITLFSQFAMVHVFTGV